MTAPIYSVKHIYKSFGSNNVLEDVSIDFAQGEIHALIGVNGAGKSTLVKIMQGIYAPDRGEMYLNGKKVTFQGPSAAMRSGVAMVFQELNLFGELSVTENVMLCQMSKNGLSIEWKSCHAKVQQLLDDLGIQVRAEEMVKHLPLAKQQLVEIAKCIYSKPKLIFLDEPSSSLSQAEEQILYRLIRNLKKTGITVVLITHKMEEIFQLCDTVSILRDGHCVAEGPVSAYTLEDMTHHMLGKSTEIFKKQGVTHGDPNDVMFSVKNLKYANVLDNISFELRRGEILAVSGLVGSGKSDLARTLFGVHRNYAGEIFLEGRPIHPRSPMEATREGIGYVPLSRKDEGILSNFTVAKNITLSVINRLGFHINRKAESQIAEEMMERFNVQPRNSSLLIGSLSGGNQQKAVLSRWIASEKKIILLDEPTRGVDVGAKQEIYDNLRKLSEQGIGVIIFSSETDELMSSSDRILIMRMGRVVKELITAKTSTEEILRYSMASEEQQEAV